jgi:hypothetical protein
MPTDTIWVKKQVQLLIKASGSSRGNTGLTPHFESGESPVSHERSKIPIQGGGGGGWGGNVPPSLLL